MQGRIPEIYAKLGVRPAINAAGNLTLLGGSVPAERTLQAMLEASRSFVMVEELQQAVNERLARLTRNEAAYVSAGAAASLYLAAAAAVSRHYDEPVHELEWGRIRKARVIVHRGCRITYDWAVRQLGVELVEVGRSEEQQDSSLEQLEAAIDSSTVAVLHVPAGWNPPGTPELQEVVAVAGRHEVPVIVDAAAQIPPSSNLWEFTRNGACVAIFSGGKGLRGPQSTGLIVGKRSILEWVERLGFPRSGFGRILKVGREEMVGLFAAVEDIVSQEDSVRRDWCEAQVQLLVDEFSGDEGIEVVRRFPNIAGQPLPYALVRPLEAGADMTPVVEALREGDPRVVVGEIPGRSGYAQGFIVNTLALGEGEMYVVLLALRKALRLRPRSSGARRRIGG